MTTQQIAPHPMLIAVGVLAEARFTSIADALNSEMVMGDFDGLDYEWADVVSVGMVALADHLLKSVAVGLGTTPDEALQRLALNVAATDDHLQFSEVGA